MSVRRKLLLSLAPLGAGLVLMALLSVLTIQTLGRSSAGILQENYLTTLVVQRILEAIENLDAVATLVTMGEDSHLGQPVDETVAENRRRFDSSLRVQEGNITEPGEKEMTEQLRSGWEAYERHLAELLAAKDPAERRRIFATEMRDAYLRIRKSASEIMALNQDAMVIKADRTQRTVRQMSTVVVASAIAAFGIGMMLSLSLLRGVLRRLERLTHAVERIGERDFGTRVEDAGTDEIAKLAGTFNRMAAHLQEFRSGSHEPL